MTLSGVGAGGGSCNGRGRGGWARCDAGGDMSRSATEVRAGRKQRGRGWCRERLAAGGKGRRDVAVALLMRVAKGDGGRREGRQSKRGGGRGAFLGLPFDRFRVWSAAFCTNTGTKRSRPKRLGKACCWRSVGHAICCFQEEHVAESNTLPLAMLHSCHS